eukprot:7531690-Pyramimonas_sp.AAC.1
MEQPLNSLFYWTPGMADAITIVSARRFVTFLGAFGSETSKPIEVFSTLGSVVGIVRKRRDAHAHFARTTPESKVSARARGWPKNQWVN